MKRAFGGIGIVAAVVVGSGVVLASSSGSPDISPVSATYKLELASRPHNLKTCVGVNGDQYVTESVRWEGAQTDTSTTPGPYSLNGVLVVSATATFDNTTGAGIAKGTTTLYTDATLSTIVYRGPFTLNSQVTDPNAKTQVARGALNLPFFTGGTANGYRLVGNQEVTVSGPGASPPLEVNGSFGGAAGAVPDLSAEYNEMTC